MGRERHLGSLQPPVIRGLGTGQGHKADCKVLQAPMINVPHLSLYLVPQRENNPEA